MSSKFNVQLNTKNKRVSVLTLEEGEVFEAKWSNNNEIGVRTDDGWIIVEENGVTSYIDDEFKKSSRFQEVLRRPDLTCTITIK